MPVPAVVGRVVFSSCVETLDLRLSESDVALVLFLRVASRLPAYSRALIPGWPNIGKEFKRFSVDAEVDILVNGWWTALK